MKKFLLSAMLLLILVPAVSAYTDDQLMQLFAPVIKYNGNELFYATPVGYGVSSSNLIVSGGVVEANPTENSIASYTTEGYYLDNRFGWFEEISAAYSQQVPYLTPTIYAHVVHTGTGTAIQYWFYYPFNNGPINNHEGDWEMIVVVLQGDVPAWAAYSQHDGGARVAWSEVEKVGETHPIVYSARGSHANYFRPYSGKLGIQNDDVGGNGVTLAPTSAGGTMQIVSLDTNQAWLNFGGRWGYSGEPMGGVTGSSGPFGPSAGNHGESWNNPTAWALSQPQTGGGAFILEWLFANFFLLFCIYVIARLAFKVIGIARAASAKQLQVGKLLSSSFTVWLIIGVVGTILVLVGSFTTWFAVNADIQSPEAGVQTNGMVELIKFDGGSGLSVNMLQKGQGMTSLFSFSVPVGIILLATILFTILDIIGAKSGRGLGVKYLLGGIMPIVFFIVIIIAISSISSMASGTAISVSQGSVPPETDAVLKTVSASPLGGAWQGPLGGYSFVALTWGLGLGAWLLILGGIIRIIAGIAMLASSPGSTQVAQPQNQVIVQQYPYSQYQQPQQQGTEVCAKCNMPVDGTSMFCNNCGNRVR